jgi:putative acetyltransferase
MNMEIKIRAEETNDIEQIRDVVRAAFPIDAESRLVDVLRVNGRAIISLVATLEERVLGHSLFSPVSTAPPGEAKGLGLAPIAVHPNAQSRGMGSKLIQEGSRLCKEHGYDYCVVLGDPNYYRRFGFEKASQFGIQNEYGVEDEFMIIRFSDHEVVGLIQYSSEFALFAL